MLRSRAMSSCRVTRAGLAQLAACYLAVLMLSDDNVSCTLVELDKDKSFLAHGPG